MNPRTCTHRAWRSVVPPTRRWSATTLDHIRHRGANDSHGVFTRIYEGNRWAGQASRSGRGSDPDQTRNVRALLPGTLGALNVHTLVDAPCGDLAWAGDLDLGVAEYIGIDVVESLILANRHRFRSDASKRFLRADLTVFPVPCADAILCRDALVHLPLRMAAKMLERFHASGSTYLITTHFVGVRRNRDVRLGDWRPLNLERPPFRFPPPLLLLYEQPFGAFTNKSLAVWRLADLAVSIDAFARSSS